MADRVPNSDMLSLKQFDSAETSKHDFGFWERRMGRTLLPLLLDHNIKENWHNTATHMADNMTQQELTTFNEAKRVTQAIRGATLMRYSAVFLLEEERQRSNDQPLLASYAKKKLEQIYLKGLGSEPSGAGKSVIHVCRVTNDDHVEKFLSPLVDGSLRTYYAYHVMKHYFPGSTVSFPDITDDAFRSIDFQVQHLTGNEDEGYYSANAYAQVKPLKVQGESFSIKESEDFSSAERQATKKYSGWAEKTQENIDNEHPEFRGFSMNSGRKILLPARASHDGKTFIAGKITMISIGINLDEIDKNGGRLF